MADKVKLFFAGSEAVNLRITDSISAEFDISILNSFQDELSRSHFVISVFQGTEGRKVYFTSCKSNNNIIDITDKFYKNHFIHYVNNFDIVFFNSDEENKYKDYERQTNLSNYANRLQEVYAREDDENREILSFLIDINSKLDEVLFLLKPNNVLNGSLNVKSLFLGGEGLVFTVSREISESKCLVQGLLRDTSGFFRFSSVSDVIFLGCVNKENIYMAKFSQLSDITMDSIIKFVFRRERDILKEV